MDEKKIIEKLHNCCKIDGDKKILTCGMAFQIAKEMNIDISIIGKLCNSEKIKLSSCQLGCF